MPFPKAATRPAHFSLDNVTKISYKTCIIDKCVLGMGHPSRGLALPREAGEGRRAKRAGVGAKFATLGAQQEPHPTRLAVLAKPTLRVGVLGAKNGGRRPPMPPSPSGRDK